MLVLWSVAFNLGSYQLVDEWVMVKYKLKRQSRMQMFGHYSQVSCYKFSQSGKSEGWIPGSFLYQLFNHCERFVSRCCRNVHIGCELPRPYALLVGDENSGDVTMCGGEWAKTCQVFWTELMMSDASPIVPYAFLLADDSCRILIGMSANSSVQAASIGASTRNLFLLYPLWSAVCCQGGANNCVTRSESWRLASFFVTMQTPGFSMLFRCFIWINVIGFFMLSRTGKYCRQQQLFEFGSGHTCTPLL